jgi:hypothetical protein
MRRRFYSLSNGFLHFRGSLDDIGRYPNNSPPPVSGLRHRNDSCVVLVKWTTMAITLDFLFTCVDYCLRQFLPLFQRMRTIVRCAAGFLIRMVFISLVPVLRIMILLTATNTNGMSLIGTGEEKVVKVLTLETASRSGTGEGKVVKVSTPRTGEREASTIRHCPRKKSSPSCEPLTQEG